MLRFRSFAVPALLFSCAALSVAPAASEPVDASAAPASAAAASQDAPDTLLTVGRYLDWENVSDPRISPDGSQVVFTRGRVDAQHDRWASAIWIMRADGSRKRFLAEGSGPRWSPDGSRIAYVAPGEDDRPQIFVKWLGEEGGPTQVTRVEESPGSLQWSPDGDRLSFTMDVPRTSAWEVEVPSPPEGAEWTEPPRVVHRVHYRLDGVGLTEEAYTHLFTVPATGGTPRQLTSGEANVGLRFDGIPFGGGYDWAPDGSTIVFDGYGFDGGDPDENYRENHIWAVDAATKEVRRLTDEPGTWSGPVVSPGGGMVAFTGYAETDLTYTASELWLVPTDGSGAKRRVTGELDRDPGDVRWARDGSGLFFTAGNEGAQNVWFAPADGSGPRRVTEGRQTVGLSSVSEGGVAVGTRSAPKRPADVVRFRLPGFEGFERLTDVNADVLADVRLGDVEEMWVTSADGTRVQGWIVKPPGFDPSGTYPMILFIHGGPHAMYDVGFSWLFQNFAANGYVVLYTNPRGSTGYGTEFGAAISQDYPGPDYPDLMAAVDSLVGRGYVDTDRQYVGGCSGGGKLSSWVIGHTDRFEAAAVLCPVIDWISFAGTSDVPIWTHGWFDAPFWEDPGPWLEHSSLMHVGQVETPTLLATGALDERTPISQTEEFYQALKMRGVSTVMLRFNEEYHGIWSKPSNFMRAQRYIVDWFDHSGEIEGVTVPAEDGGG